MKSQKKAPDIFRFYIKNQKIIDMKKEFFTIQDKSVWQFGEIP